MKGNAVRENCVCGAHLDYEGKDPMMAATQFRYDHTVCRVAAFEESHAKSQHLLAQVRSQTKSDDPQKESDQP